MPQVFTERSEVPLVTLNLCVMRRYNLGEGEVLSTPVVRVCSRPTHRFSLSPNGGGINPR